MCTHTWRDRPDGPWIIEDGDDDPTDFDHVRSFLLNTRYWWLEGVDTAKLRKGIDKILSKHDIETIAPGYGCILRGKKTVEKHIKLVDDVLSRSTSRSRRRATSAATRRGDQDASASSGHARPSQPAAARGRARHLLAGRMPGAAPAGQDLSRLQRLVPDRRRHRLDAGRDRPPEGLPDHRGAAQHAARRQAAAEISLRHAPGDAALRRARPRAVALSGRDPRAATSATTTSPSRNTNTACA